jgi:hypothetical protein
MSLRYYPLSKIKKNKSTNGIEFLLNGNPYSGKYYETFDGKFFTGANPIVGKNERLVKITEYEDAIYLNTNTLPKNLRDNLSIVNNNTEVNEIDRGRQIELINRGALVTAKFKGEPTSYFPTVIEDDYYAGFIMRYFSKRTNSAGYVIEISPDEYFAIQDGTVPYDVSNYLTTKIMWKITGPLNQKRVSQYDVRAGIIDTNKRLVETAEKTFLGIVAYIGGKYDKFARPTE